MWWIEENQYSDRWLLCCGKMAQALLALLHFDYVDTGYVSAITFICCWKNILKNLERILPMLPDIHIKCAWTNNKNRTYLNWWRCDESYPQPSVQNLVSQFSTIPAVEDSWYFCNNRWPRHGVVMDGRDIGICRLAWAQLKNIHDCQSRRPGAAKSQGIIK